MWAVQDFSQLVQRIQADDCCPFPHSLLGMGDSGMAKIGSRKEVGGPQVRLVHIKFRSKKTRLNLRFSFLHAQNQKLLIADVKCVNMWHLI